MMERFQVDWNRLKKLNLKLINLDDFIMTWDITFFEIQIRKFPNSSSDGRNATAETLLAQVFKL